MPGSTKPRDASQVIEVKLRSGHNPELFKAYSALDIDEEFLSLIRKRLRGDTEVSFNFASPEIFTLGSSILNRLLVTCLLKGRMIERKLAKLSDKAARQLENGRYEVVWEPTGDKALFDVLVVRHGPPKDYFSKSFPNVFAECGALRDAISALRLTEGLEHRVHEFFSG